ncbi:VENN motif pre-toxin domain-containing protein, partial [Snodgrassella alvi]|uniref:VENN motif pre-toxin domain-containing protein n=1 Tax=Snodgrassella alvi TaxID=1196083 RepID=UPI0015D551BE
PKEQYPEAIDPATGEIDPNRLPENVKGSIRDLSSAIGTVAGGLSGGTLSNAQIAGELGQNAVENNALINSKGESKLNAQERKINEKLKKAGVQSADDYQRKYDACQTKECQQQVIENYKKASEEASQIILSLYLKGQLTEEESKILLTSYASKMMQGAGESQDGWGTPIFNMDAQKWTPSGKIANAAFQKITLTNLVRDMKQSGATEQQIGMRVLQFQIAGQALSSYSLSDQVDALYGTGMSLGTMLNVMSIKRGKAFSMDEIKAITNRYNSHSGSLVTANGVVIKDKPQSSTVSESRGANQSGGKGNTEPKTSKDGDKGASKAGKGTTGNSLEWNSWQNYKKKTIDGKQYAQIGDRLYSQHAVDRMQPSGLGSPAGTVGAGRNISPGIVEHTIQNGTKTSSTVNGVERIVHWSGDVGVVTESNGKIIVTILRRSEK